MCECLCVGERQLEYVVRVRAHTRYAYLFVCVCVCRCAGVRESVGVRVLCWLTWQSLEQYETRLHLPQAMSFCGAAPHLETQTEGGLTPFAPALLLVADQREIGRRHRQNAPVDSPVGLRHGHDLDGTPPLVRIEPSDFAE
jgi:hypothetical protein